MVSNQTDFVLIGECLRRPPYITIIVYIYANLILYNCAFLIVSQSGNAICTVVQEKSEPNHQVEHEGQPGIKQYQDDGSNDTTIQPSIFSSINSDGSGILFYRSSVDTSNIQLLLTKSQAPQISTGSNGLGGINAKGGGGELNRLEDLSFSNLLLGNNDQLVKGTVDKELELQQSQPHHSLGEYIHCAGYVTIPSNAYCNAVCDDQESGSNSYMNPPADFGEFYIVVHKMCASCTCDVCIYSCDLCWRWHLTLYFHTSANMIRWSLFTL